VLPLRVNVRLGLG